MTIFALANNVSHLAVTPIELDSLIQFTVQAVVQKYLISCALLDLQSVILPSLTFLTINIGEFCLLSSEVYFQGH